MLVKLVFFMFPCAPNLLMFLQRDSLQDRLENFALVSTFDNYLRHCERMLD
jgi:hypothetical protein